MIAKIINTVVIKVLLALLSIILLLLNSNFLGAEGLGTIALIILEIAIYLLISNLVTGGSLVYYASRIRITELFIISYTWMITTALFLYFTLSYIPFISIEYLDHILLLGLLQSGVSTHINLLAGKQQIKPFNLTSLIQGLVQVLSLFYFYFILNEKTVISFIYSTYIAYAIAFIYSLIKLMPYLELSFSLPKKNSFATVIQYGLYIQTANISQLLNYRLSYFLLEYYSGRSAIGLFSAGVQLSEGVLLPSKSIGIVQYARLSNTKSILKSANLTLTLLKLSFIITLPFLLILIAIPKAVFIALLGEDFGLTSLVIGLMSLGIIMLASEVILSRFFSGSGHQKVNATSSTLGLIATLVFGFLLIPHYGFKGAAITYSLSFSAMFIYMLFKFRQITGVGFQRFLISKTDFQLIFRVVRRFGRRASN